MVFHSKSLQQEVNNLLLVMYSFISYSKDGYLNEKLVNKSLFKKF